MTSKVFESAILLTHTNLFCICLTGGSKTTLFQGGVRGTSFITAGSGSTMIPTSIRGTTYTG